MSRYLMSEKTAAFVRGLMDRKSPNSAHGQTRYSRPAFAVEDSFAHPFEVRFAASIDDGEGAWIIWLPSSKCLIVDGEAVDLADELEGAGDPYPAGWYVLEDVPSSGGSVYLNVTPGDDSEGATAVFSTSASQTAGDIPILVAVVAKDSTTGGVTITQTVSSALVFGTGGQKDATPMPFDYVETESESNGETVVSKALTRCQFYFDGTLQSLSDYSGLPETSGTVYLVCTGTFDDETGEYEWEFELANTAGTASTGAEVINIKLYDFADGRPSVDYRSTFLTLQDNVQPAKFEVVKPGGSCSILLDASGDAPKLVMTDGTNTVTIDLDDIPSNCDGSFGLKSFTFKDTSGNTKTYHGLFCGNIDLTNIAAALNKAFSVNGTKVADIAASANISLTEKSLSAGTGIALSVNGNVITISATGSGGGSTSGFTGTRTVLADTDYDTTNHRLRRRYYAEVWADGVLTSSTLGEWEAYHQAVEETV